MKRYVPFLFLLIVICAFFYQVFLFGKIPFPGDLLLSEYAPWRHSSYFGYVAGAIPQKAQYFDVIRELYPWKTLVTDQVKQGIAPLWNPYNFSGTPLLANYQSQVFYPLTFLYYLFPQTTAWTMLVILQPVLSSIFLYMFCLTIGLSPLGAIVAALTFSFSSFASSWMEFNTVWHTILWLPFFFYLLEKGICRKQFTLGQKALFIAALFSSITAGHPQDFINVFLFFSVYTACRILTLSTWSLVEKKAFIIKEITPVLVLPFFLAAIQLVPTIELFRLSSRVPHDITSVVNSMLVQFWQLPQLVYQDFFGNPATRTYIANDTYVGKTLSIGVVGFLLAIYSFFQTKKSFHWKFFALSGTFILFLNIHTPLSPILYRIPVPILSTGTPTRNLFILMLSLSVLAGYGYDFLKNQKKKTFMLLVFPSLLTTVFLWGAAMVLPKLNLFSSPASIIIKSAAVASVILAAATVIGLAAKKISWALWGIVFLVIAELGYGFVKFNPFVPSSFVFPKNDVLTYLAQNAGINRFWGYGTARFESNVNIQYRLFSADGTDPLNFSFYNMFIQSAKDGHIPKTFTRFTRSDVALLPGYGQRDLPDNQFRLRIMDLLGVKYVLDRPENPKANDTFAADRFKKVFETTDSYTIYENLHVLPRYFLAGQVQTYTNNNEFESVFFNPSFLPRETILLPKNTPIFDIKPSAQSSVELISYEPTTVHLKTQSDTNQLLFLSDSYAPGWNAAVDGDKTPVYRADYAFRAVFVPKGTHDVIFSYQPESFQTGAAVSLGALGISLLTLLVCTLRRNKAR